MAQNINNYKVVERAVRWLIIMLLAEFVLGTMLTTVISYDPDKPGTMQTLFLIVHILVGALLFGSFAHILTSRKSHLLGSKPIIAFLLIVIAIAAGAEATRSGSNLAVLVMSLAFGAALVTYGLSYLEVQQAMQVGK